MRILQVADRLSDRGGAFTHLLGLLAELSRRHEITVAVGRVETAAPAYPLVVCPGLDARGDRPVPALADLAGRGAFDLVHLHNVVNPAVLRWAAGAGPAVVSVQDHRFFCPGRGKWTRAGEVCRETMGERACAACFDDAGYFEEVFELTRARLDALRCLPVIVLSEYMRSELVAVGLDAARVHVIPPFVRPFEAGPGQQACGPSCVLFVGRLTAHKGVQDAVAAWKLSGLDLPLVFAGSGPLRAEVERQGFEVTGWLDREELARCYRRARAVLLPSRWQEPYGIVGPEAMSLGVPVVSWQSGGVAEWHRGERVEWGDVEGLARALRPVVGGHHPPVPLAEAHELARRLEKVYREAVRGLRACDDRGYISGVGSAGRGSDVPRRSSRGSDACASPPRSRGVRRGRAVR